LWSESGSYPVIGQGSEQIEGWTDRQDLLVTPNPSIVLYGGHTRRVKRVTTPFVPGPNVKLLQPHSGLDSAFLTYFLMHLPIENRGYADHFPLVRKSLIPLPPLSEQRRIVDILDKTFENIAIASANTEKNIANAKELFQSELDAIFEPRGGEWELLTVRDLVNRDVLHKPFDGNHGDAHPTRRDYVSVGVPFLMTSDLHNGLADTRNCKHISRKMADALRTGFARDNDVLLSHKGTIGKAAVLHTDLDYVILTPQLTSYRVVDPRRLLNRYLYYYFQNTGFQRTMSLLAGAGSTRSYLGITKQLDLPIAIPPLPEQRQITARLDKLSETTLIASDLYRKKSLLIMNLKPSVLHAAFDGEL
jgi:type I restriction enzyme S subunit